MPRRKKRRKIQIPPPPDRVIIDVEQDYGPDLPAPPPEEVGWAEVEALEDRLTFKSIKKPTIWNSLFKELEKILHTWVGNSLYVEKQSEESKNLAQAIEFASYLKEAKILKILQRRPNPTDIPQLVKFSAYTEDIGSIPTDGLTARSHFAHGASLSPPRALWKALGECAERYSQTRYRQEEFEFTSFARLGSSKALDPTLLSAFSENEKRLHSRREVSKDSRFAWSAATNIKSGKKILAPAQLFFFNYRLVPEEPYLRQPISTGSAGAFSLEEAVYGGLCEAIERDAFMIAYMNELNLPRVNLTSVRHPEIRELVDSFERYQLRLEVVDMTTDIQIPSMLAIVVDEYSDRGPAVTVGAKTDLDSLWAIRGAIEEVWHGLHGGRWTAEHERARIFRPWTNKEVVQPDDRFWFWGRPAMRKYIDFFLHHSLKGVPNRKEFVPRNPRAFLEKALSLLDQAGMTNVYYKEFSLPSLSGLGFRTVMTLVPELVHLFIDENDRATGNPRLKGVPKRIGYKPTVRLNPIPHPFA